MSFGGVYRNRRVLITGHTGFKGSWLAQWLLDLGAQVCGYSVDVPTKPSHFEVLGLERRMTHVLGDIRDLGALKDAFRGFRPEMVFHLAAQPIVRASYGDPLGTLETNVIGTAKVLEAVISTPSVKTAVFIATDKCYENKEWEYGYRETDPLGGKDPYSASKACAEIVFGSYFRSFVQGQREIRMASARAGNVVGGGDWAADRIIPDCMRAWSSKKTVRARNPGSTRPWQHVLEPLSGYLALGAGLWSGAPNLDGEAFNFGPSNEVNQPVSTLIEGLQRVWKDGAWEIDPSGIGNKKEAGLLKLSSEKALSRLGWKAALSFEQTIRMTAEWYKDYYDGKADMVEKTVNQIKEYQSLTN